MSNIRVIELSLPGHVQFCDLGRRVIMEACKLVGTQDMTPTADDYRSAELPPERYEFDDTFTMEFVSAFSEIFNNIALHAYGGRALGTVAFQIAIGADSLIVDICDMGKAFDIDSIPPPGELPTGGMGIFLARAMLDELEYRPGPPNRWRLVKYIAMGESDATTSVGEAEPA